MDTSVRPVQPPKPRRFHEKANEVRRRKEAAERLIKERHEAVRRQHEEKIMKINEERLRQQRELKERHAKELKRQQDVLQRRMALMERDNARKKEILEKNHAAASRLVTGSSRKKYAFGSSTPREPSFLECRQLKNQDKHPLRERQVPTAGSAHEQHGRSAISVMTSSMYTPSDSSRENNSVSRLSCTKVTPTKSQDLMTQSVCNPTKMSLTPISRLRKKPLNQLTNSVPNTAPANTCATSKFQSKVQKAKERKVMSKLMYEGLAMEKRSPSSIVQPKEVVTQESSEHFNKRASVDAKTEPLYFAASPDEIALEIYDTDAPADDEINAILPIEDVVHQETHCASSYPLETEVQTTEDDWLDTDHSKSIESESCGANEVCLSITFAQATAISSVEESASIVVSDLNAGFEAPVLWTSADVENNSDTRRFASPIDSECTEEQTKELVNDETNACIATSGMDMYSDGLAKQLTSVIPGDIPGAVHTPKEIDSAMVKKLPSPPNEFVAHRIRREQEQRELDERKARIAAILAKSRDLSSATPVVTGRTSPPRGQTAQDVLKRLASNGNLPSLQKLVSRHTSQSSAVDQIAPEDPAPQAI